METVEQWNARLKHQSAGGDFLKWAWLVGKHPGKIGEAIAEAPRFELTSPKLMAAIRNGTVQAGDLYGSSWGDAVANFHSLSREWVNRASSGTVYGSLQNRVANFNQRTIVSTDNVTADYVAAGASIPVQAPSLSDNAANLLPLKLACIVVVTAELFELWSPSSEAQLDDVLQLALRRGLDGRLLDPDSGAVAGTRPASVLNGIDPLGDFTNTSSGALADLEDILGTLIDEGSNLDRVIIAMHPTTCLALSVLQSNGIYTFPALGPRGGFVLNNIPVVTSVSCVRSGSPSEKFVCAIDGSRVIVADDGVVSIEASRLATVEQSDAPTGSSVTPTGTSVTSMYQTSSTALKLVRPITWQTVAGAAAWMTATF